VAESRYEGMNSVWTKRHGKMVRGRALRRNKAWSFNFSQYIVQEGDRIDLLAAKFYGDDGMWYYIADANPEVLDWFSIYPGQMIRIPNVLA
jgi:Uncharacterized protein containing LysM domain